MKFARCLFLPFIAFALAGCDDKPTTPGSNPIQNPSSAAGAPATPGSNPIQNPSSAAGAPRTLNAPPAPISAIEVSFTDGVLEIKGQKISLPCDPSDLEKLLGKPSKIQEGGVNTAIVWDDIGIRALEKPATRKVIEIAFRFGPGKFDNITKQSFTGKLVIDGATMTGDSDIAELARTKKGEPVVQSKNRGQYWSIEGKGVPHVTIETKDEKGKGVLLVSVSKDM